MSDTYQSTFNTGADIDQALQNSIDHIVNTENPHGTTKSHVGLGNADNTSDKDKPLSDAAVLALEDKVDKVAGKGLSTNDYTDEDKFKLAGIETGAEVNPDIADDLETDDATKVLSAKQGKALKNLVSTNKDLIDTNLDVAMSNKITNGGFATNTDGWAKILVTLTSIGGVAEMTGQKATDGTNRAYQVHEVPEGNKWYASADVKATTNLTGIGYPTANRLASHSGNGNWERLSFVKTRTIDTAIALVDNRTSGWDTVYFDNVLIVDLTATFGAGNEPTKEEMDKLIDIVGWWDGTLTPTMKQLLNWELKMIRQNRTAIIALGGTIV